MSLRGGASLKDLRKMTFEQQRTFLSQSPLIVRFRATLKEQYRKAPTGVEGWDINIAAGAVSILSMCGF